MRSIPMIVGAAVLVLAATRCTDDRDTDAVGADSGISADIGLDVSDECDRFCIWERYLEASQPAVFASCFCQPQLSEDYVVQQQLVDICGANEADASEFTVADVEQACIEAMSDEMLDELVEYSACITARLAEVEPCLRSLEVGDLCSTCESYLTESGNSCIDAELNDTLSACMDNRPGF